MLMNPKITDSPTVALVSANLSAPLPISAMCAFISSTLAIESQLKTPYINIHYVEDTASAQFYVRFALASNMLFKAMPTFLYHCPSSYNIAATKSSTKHDIHNGTCQERTKHSCCDCPVRCPPSQALDTH